MSIPEQNPANPLGVQAQQQPQTQKVRSNVYTMMLILAFFALVTACVLLYLELSTYGDYPWWNAKSAGVYLDQTPANLWGSLAHLDTAGTMQG